MTRNTFVFGIGGTGARVIRALTMLLASGVEINHDGKIIPVIVDVDAENEDTSRTIKALNLYKQIRSGAYGENTQKQPGFFGTSLNTLSSQQIDKGDNIREEFQLKFAGISSTFSSYLKLSDMEGIDEEFMKLLYDDSPSDRPEAELNLQLSKGFKGNPNIGCIVFNELESSPEFKYFLNAMGEHDRIFIISSIFGGTGSAGFPQLLKLLKGKDSKNTYVKDAKTGAVTVMPYFAVQQDANSAIDSNRFISKTKAALSYYESEMDLLDSMYYLYDKPGSAPYENNEGGKAQKNNAHVVEMIAAAAVIDFSNRETFDSDSKFYEYGIRQDITALDVRHFFEGTRQKVLSPLTHFTYAAKIWLDYVPGALSEAFARELSLDKNLQSDSFYTSLTAFFREHYLQWLLEMEANNRTFKPFNIRDGFNTMVTGGPIKTSMFHGGITDRFLNTELGKAEAELHKTIPQNPRRMLLLLNKVTDKCFEKLERMPAIA